jgi:hypothetical protein
MQGFFHFFLKYFLSLTKSNKKRVRYKSDPLYSASMLIVINYYPIYLVVPIL